MYFNSCSLVSNNKGSIPEYNIVSIKINYEVCFYFVGLNISETEDNIYFQSTFNKLTRFQFTRDAVANISCSQEDYESPFIPEGLIVFHLVRKEDIIHNISSVTVKSPFSY